MDNKWTVYIHINKINGKKYVGITSQNPEKRWGTNGCKYRKGYFRNAINKYGWNSFQHDIVATNLCETDAKIIEKKLIEVLNTKAPNGYNLTLGGDGALGYSPTQETKCKMSKASKEKWRDKEFLQKMIELRHNSNSVYQSKEFKEKISSIVRGEKNPNYNHKWSDEQKNNLRIKQKQNPMYLNETNPNAKRIRCIETGEIFDCMKFAQEKYGLKTTGSFTAAIKKGKTAAGYHWEYI
jgi:group I intron endonuclease